MATLTNQKIKDTYNGLLKTSDNAAIDGTLKNLQDGVGNDLPIQVSNTTIKFTGTVEGLAAGGLVAGTPADSMKSADTLTTNPAVVTGAKSIAIGEDAQDLATGESNIAIGTGARTVDNPGGGAGESSVAIGVNASAENLGIAIGKDTKAGGTSGSNSRCIAIGEAAEAPNNGAIALGYDAYSRGQNSVAIGTESNVSGFYTGAVCIGLQSEITGGFQTIAIGQKAATSATNAIAIGGGTNTTNRTEATQNGAVALGAGVKANIIDTVSVKALEVQTDSTPTAGGIIMSDAGGTDRRLNITASGGLQVDGNAVGGATQFELPAFTVPANATSDICYAVVTIPANTFAAGDILELRSLEKRDSLNNTVYESYWFSEQSQTVGTAVQAGTAYQQAGIQSADNGSTYYQKTLWIDATNTTVFPYGAANETSAGVVQGGDPVESQPVDWTVTQYFYYQGYSDATVGTVENFGTLLRKIN